LFSKQVTARYTQRSVQYIYVWQPQTDIWELNKMEA